MQNIFLFISGISGFIAVSLGALGSHYLKTKITAEQLATFEKGVFYQFIHTIAILALVVLMNKMRSRTLIAAGLFFIAGIFFFSGSLYLLSLREFFNIQNLYFPGILTPIGGLFFISGWIMVGAGAFRT